MKQLISIAIALIFSLQLHAQVKIDRTKAPKSGPAPLIFLKKPVITKLSNGLTLLVVEDHRLPKVSARFLGNTGLFNEVDKAGLMNITYAMLNEGTLSIPKAKFDETLDLTGSTLKFTATEANLSALTRHFDVALRLMAKAITEPALEQKALDKIKAQQITQLQLQGKNTTFIAEQLTNVLAYGKTHPKGAFTRPQTIQKILLQDVKDAYKKHIIPQGSYLVVIGDITPEAASQLAQKLFCSWKGNLVKNAAPAMAYNPAGTEIDIINTANSAQSDISIVNLINVKLSDPDYFPLLVANRIFGAPGSPNSRLSVALREKYAFSYQQSSGIGPGLYQGMFKASALVRNAKTDSAVLIMINEIKWMQTEKVGKSELNVAKAGYNGSFALGMEDNERVSTFATNVLINKLPADFYQKFLQKVNAVTADDILRVAKKYIDYKRIVVTADEKLVADGLIKTGYPVKTFDTEGNPIQ